jgi:hypothetical protein
MFWRTSHVLVRAAHVGIIAFGVIATVIGTYVTVADIAKASSAGTDNICV